MPLVGKVLWWDERDGNGIILDPTGNEFYFDSSVISKTSKAPRTGQYVKFELNLAVRGTLCAFKVVFPTARNRSSIERKFTKKLSDVSV